MEYQALYRKYRPTNFKEIVGQEHIKTSLLNAIKSKKINHAYLFSGPKGTGKTSIAKIFAAQINQISYERSCNSLDIVEIDAASNNGVSEVREIIQQIKFLPSELIYKVYIIDEVHMLSKGAFNALLKTLEEPPERVIFLLATTEVQKIPLTVVSRTQKFNFERINTQQINIKLHDILQKESIKFETNAIEKIAQIAKGSLRDGIKIIDQIAIYNGNNIDYQAIESLFSLVNQDSLIQFINLCCSKDFSKLIKQANILYQKGIEIQQFISDLLTAIKDFIFFKKLQVTNYLSLLNEKNVLNLKISYFEAYELLEKLILLKEKLFSTEDPFQVFEFFLLNICKEAKNDEIKVQPTKIKTQKLIDKTDKLLEKTKKTVETALQNVQTNREAVIKPNKVNDLNSNQLNLISSQNLVKRNYTPPISRFVELLTLHDKAIMSNLKKCFTKLNKLLNNNHYNKFATWLTETKFVSAGKNFIILAHSKKANAELINANVQKIEFLQFLKKLFGEPLHTFVMVNEDFAKIQKAYIDLKKLGSLPKIAPLKSINISELQKKQSLSQDEKKDEKIKAIFGSIEEEE